VSARKEWAEHTIWTEFLCREIDNLKRGEITEFLIESLESAYKETELNDAGTRCALCSRKMQPGDTKWKSAYKFPACGGCLSHAASHGWD